MNKLEELKQKYKELGEEIEKLEKQGKVWKPQKNEEYGYITPDGEVFVDEWDNYDMDNERYEIGNCFKTREEAAATVEKIKIYTQLKRLAEEINTEPVDWGNSKQHKYRIEYNHDEKGIEQEYNSWIQRQGSIYCTNLDFLKIAKERIGEENLLKLFEE